MFARPASPLPQPVQASSSDPTSTSHFISLSRTPSPSSSPYPYTSPKPSPTSAASDSSSSFLSLPYTPSFPSGLTPPPSPSKQRPKPHQSTFSIAQAEALAAVEAQKNHRFRFLGTNTISRTRLVVLAVPLLLLVLITLCTRYLSHPAFFDIVLGAPAGHTEMEMDQRLLWSSTHSPHQHIRRQDSGSGSDSSSSDDTTTTASAITAASTIAFPTSLSLSSSPSSSSAAATSTGLPTVPTATPVLPSPFPQPWDTTSNNNFSTVACLTFVSNMTNSEPFRQCRPFSLLSQTSSAFLEAQDNSTLLNVDIWGTCNTPVDNATCVSNMAWFEGQLKSVCGQELTDQVPVVVQALTGLQTYTLLRTTGCLTDPTTNTYCYLSASFSSNPSDLYFYSLPWGKALPNSTQPTCSSCTKSVMAVYEAALTAGGDGEGLDGLKKTYEDAAGLAQQACGTGYVQNAESSTSGARGGRGREGWRVWGVGVVVVIVGVGLL